MRLFWKFFTLLVLILVVPVTFVGCGSSRLSEEEASRNEEADGAGMAVADDDDNADNADDDDGDDSETAVAD